MAKITRNIIAEFTLKEEEIVQSIWDMDCVDQLYLIARLDDICYENAVNGAMQLQAISDLMERPDVDLEIKNKVKHFIGYLKDYLLC